MKIAMYTSRFQPAWDWGGPVRSSWNLARGLSRQGAKVVVVTTRAGQRGQVDVPAERTESGVKIRARGVLGRGRWALANRFALSPGVLLDLLQTLPGADLVHIEGLWSAGHPLAFLICRMLGKPYVVCPRGNLEGWSLAQKALKKKVFLNLVARKNISRARAVLFTTSQERDTAPDWLRRLTALVVPNPVEVKLSGDGGRFRQGLDLDPGVLLLGVVGRVHPKKGFDLLLPALARARTARPVHLVVVGPDEEGYAAKVQELIVRGSLQGRVHLLGKLGGQDLADAYAGLDALMVPSYEENFGNVVVEALAQGTPVVVSEEVGLRRWVERRGVGAVLPQLEQAWLEFLQDGELERLLAGWDRARARRIARTEFSLETVCSELLAEYRKLIGPRAPGPRKGSG